MNHKLIDHPDYFLLVDLDAEITTGDYAYWSDAIIIAKITDLKAVSNGIKIIAHFPKKSSPVLEGVNLLPELRSSNEDIELEKEVRQYIKDNNYDGTLHPERQNGMYDAYKAAMKQSDKMFSYPDMIACFKAGEDSKENELNGDGETTPQEYLESLTPKQPIPIDFILGEGETIEEQIKNGKWIFK